uniref:Uncharacterized protein n=1 Tax=Oryza meridionalis TaxID=40149 RepID=A0A0E0F507_9ORYZ
MARGACALLLVPLLLFDPFWEPAGIFFGMALLERFGLQQIDLHNMFAEFRGFQLPGRSTAGGSQLIAELMLLVVNTLLQGQTAGCGFSSLEG